MKTLVLFARLTNHARLFCVMASLMFIVSVGSLAGWLYVDAAEVRMRAEVDAQLTICCLSTAEQRPAENLKLVRLVADYDAFCRTALVRTLLYGRDPLPGQARLN